MTGEVMLRLPTKRIMSATAAVPAISPAMGEISPASKNPTPLDARAAIPICVHPSSADALPMLRVKPASASAFALGLQIPRHDRSRKNMVTTQYNPNHTPETPRRKIKLIIT